jgi:hypothetical protein
MTAMLYSLRQVDKLKKDSCLSILDLTGTDLIECMYGYTEMEAFVTYFDMDSRVSAHSVAGIYTDFVL